MRLLWPLVQQHLVAQNDEEVLIGGQAVIEGVMMRCPHSYCVAVRRADGRLVTEEAPLAKLSERSRWWGWPVLRGVGTLGQALWLGMKALRFSANAALPEGGRGKEISPAMMAVNLAVSLGFFVFLYKFVPLYLATQLGAWLPAAGGRIAFNVADGLIRIVLFVAFLLTISLWKDIRRVFEYHGAEHRVVFAFEAGGPLTVENAQRFSTYHPRCGTSFLMVVMLISIAAYALLPFEDFGGRFAARVLLLPVIAGVSYEVIRAAARARWPVLGAVAAPGLWLQRITTRPPCDEQVAVAIRALEGALALEQAQGGQPAIA
ncbi:MAG: DUF1385 domain-containing protein [Bryobacterales bacterium]|nr:DUF1385 domain-containing protein [Bryobacteraceae bacterium]MDW8130531.1 DUF1385 domain-containing protein [Bryobacterales bacterium]